MSVTIRPLDAGAGGPRDLPGAGAVSRPDPTRPSRRAFLHLSALRAAAAALTPAFLAQHARAMAPPDLTADTLNGLVAFIVPGPDPYSIRQGLDTPEPGGIAANATAALIFTLNLVELAPPPFPGFADLVAVILNNVASAFGAAPNDPFASPFANRLFDEKVAIYQAMESGLIDPALVPLAGILPVLTAFIAFSDAGVFDPADRAPVARPVGWDLAGYEGVADGRDAFQGYFQNRKKVVG